jgi:folate-binding protein YgfZ
VPEFRTSDHHSELGLPVANNTDISMEQVRISGPDAQIFLQGQLSNDMATLELGASTLAGLHSPQGRVIALLQLRRESPEDFVALVPTELADIVAARLQRFVLRAKLHIGRAAAAQRPAAMDSLAKGAAMHPVTRAERIIAGLPQVYVATTELFVAQMLNLDLIGGISFTKGCYTGQEVIARAHYRGRVKRRMQRFVSNLPCQLAPGDQCRLQDGRSAQIVDAATRVDGRTDFLAVTTLPANDAKEAGSRDDPATATTVIALRPALLECTQLELPYKLPAATQ